MAFTAYKMRKKSGISKNKHSKVILQLPYNTESIWLKKTLMFEQHGT